MRYLFIFLVTMGLLPLTAQDLPVYDQYIPLEHLNRLEGQGWKNIGYTRFPKKAEKLVRPDVWSLANNSAGLAVRFKTNADHIVVKYRVKQRFSMPHMPTTGVSGVDLYLKHDRQWQWCKGAYQFGDTVQYRFPIKQLQKKQNEYVLYLPLYNIIADLTLGVPKGSAMELVSPIGKKPIVVYGTSIAQGACATRPGMAWTNILARQMDYPVINLGFSGNGRLEEEVVGLINEIEASVFVLDCMPNLSRLLKKGDEYAKREVIKRVRRSVIQLRETHRETPILLVQHAGYSDAWLNPERKHIYESLNFWMTQTFEELQKQGYNKLFMLSKDTIDLNQDSFVDGTHPNDLGMIHYAKSYQDKLETILSSM
ncbi:MULTISPECIES: SGNH/GDSL hydrolase family protein [Flavobacteriaceae]|uniref:SGNH/GDSL hydrolase family protein n=1 Tax=Flavobacteriaceae TaxID=49546 RepID=UPI001FE99BCD|nr:MULTISPECIES: SGNH/GDSL hydrolase family protein [Allomuricauda]MDC6366826.1 SGNH/GDSL hydrolase family protein [Muricauda sp. AC10]